MDSEKYNTLCRKCGNMCWFGPIFSRGIFRGDRLMYWCARCGFERFVRCHDDPKSGRLSAYERGEQFNQ